MTLDQYFAALLGQILLLTFLSAGVVVAVIGLMVFAIAGLLHCLRGRSNCMFYAWFQYWNHGAWVMMVRSLYGWWPHFRFSLDQGLTWHEYVPVGPKRKRWIPPLIFTGEVRDVTCKVQ